MNWFRMLSYFYTCSICLLLGVVECMAAGTVVLAHDSGGPKLDIVVDHNGQRTGFLASDADSYAACLNRIFSLDADKLMNIRRNARESVKRFSDARFSETFLGVTEHLLFPECWHWSTGEMYNLQKLMRCSRSPSPQSPIPEWMKVHWF